MISLESLRLAEKWDKLLNVARKVETGGVGLDQSPPNDFIPYVDAFAQYAPPEQYPRILDVGAGSGAETHILQKKGYTVTGITYGKDNVAYAKEHFGIDLIEMDMHSLDFPDASFDGAFTVQTFEHTFAPWLFVIELRRVLRDGGIVFIDVPDPDDDAQLRTIWHTSVLYPNQLKALFWKAGFNEVADRTQKHRVQLLFGKLPDGTFQMWSYVKWIVSHQRQGD